MGKAYLHKVAAMDTILERMSKGIPQTYRHAHSVIEAARTLRNAVEALGQLQATPDPTVTQAAHEKRVSNAAKKLIEQKKAAADRFHAFVRDGIQALELRINERVKLKSDEKYAAEIRAVFRSMSHTDRLALMKQLAEENRGPELAAIVSVPPLLIGLKAELQQVYADQIVFLHAKPEWEERKTLIEMMVPAMTIAAVATEAATEFSASPNRIAEIERGEAAARAADATFNSTVQS